MTDWQPVNNHNPDAPATDEPNDATEAAQRVQERHDVGKRWIAYLRRQIAGEAQPATPETHWSDLP